MRYDDAIARLAERMGEPAPPIAPLAAFADLVALWNAKLNLTGARDPEALSEVLFADALALAPRLPPGVERLVDVGAGGGAPAIPLALLVPGLRALLIEPRRNRVAFLRSAIGTLGLVDRVEAQERRLEGPPLPEVDLAMSRATFEPAEWLTRAAGLAPWVVVLAGAAGLPEETPAGLERTLAHAYALPFTGSARTLGIYRAT